MQAALKSIYSVGWIIAVGLRGGTCLQYGSPSAQSVIESKRDIFATELFNWIADKQARAETQNTLYPII